MIGRTRDQLYIDVVNVVAATTTSGEGGIFTQAALAAASQCSTATLNADMKLIVKKSRVLFPGYCLEIGKARRPGDGQLVFRYRVVDEQSKTEIDESKRRVHKARTAIYRAIDEVSVAKAGPGAQAAAIVIETGIEMVMRGLELIETPSADVS
jgi:hypothetical protein